MIWYPLTRKIKELVSDSQSKLEYLQSLVLWSRVVGRSCSNLTLVAVSKLLNIQTWPEIPVNYCYLKSRPY